MAYATVNDLINDAVSFYNDTDAINYIVPDSTKRRITHYAQRTLDEIWYYRPWSFKMMEFDVTPTGGEAQLPYNFATVGPKGGLFETGTSRLWTEIDYQEWITLRQQSPGFRQERVYCIGLLQVADPNAAFGDGTTGINYRSILFPDTAESRSFQLYYEGTPPRLAWDPGVPAYDYTLAIPLTEGFHNVLLLGTIAKLQEGKGDPRPQFRSEYIASLATAAAQHLPLTSRMQQMPRALPGGLW